MSHWLVSSSGQLARNVKLRSWLLLGVLLSSTWWMAHAFGQHYAIEQWLFFRYARCWLITAVYCLASLSVGHRIVVAFSRPGERQDGHVTLSFSTGMLAFFLLTYLVGILRGYGTVAFFGIPAVLLLVGAPRLFRDLWAFWQRHRGTWFRPLSAGEALGAGAGAIALTLLYVPLLIPENTAYDTRWYHLGLAEHYAAAGGLVRLPEGPLFGTIPQLATVVYTWVFLLPGSELFDRVVLAGHIEFAIFLFTLGGVPALVRALVPGVRARMAWIAVFFFPSIFLYDATLTVAADHIAALWVIPAYLTFLRVWRDLRPEASALFVAQLCGLVLTKYTTLTVVAFPILAYLARAAQLAWAQIRGRGGGTWAKGALTAVGVGAVLSSPHWLKNLIWYGDPVYPILRHHLSVRPWTSDSEHLYRVYESVAWMARGSTFDKAQGAWHALYNYSLALYNWADFHGLFPIFGSLFTFGLLALPFLPRARRIWPLVVATHLGIVIWFLLFHHDRYLQSLLPWMAAAIAAMAALAWRAGLAARLGVVVLGGTQLVWGLDMIAWPIHHMTGKSSLSLVSDFFSKSYQKDFAARTRPFEDLVSIGRALPSGATVLLHHDHVRLGLAHRVVSDALRVQMGLSYSDLGSPRAVHRLLRSWGVTHVIWEPRRVYGDDSIASELVFHEFVSRFLINPQTIGGRRVAELSPTEPPESQSIAFYFACDAAYQNGLYRLGDLDVSPLTVPGEPPEAPRRPLERFVGGDAGPYLAKATHAVVDRSCPEPPETPGFDALARWGSKDLLVREPSAPAEEAR